MFTSQCHCRDEVRHSWEVLSTVPEAQSALISVVSQPSPVRGQQMTGWEKPVLSFSVAAPMPL